VTWAASNYPDISHVVSWRLAYSLFENTIVLCTILGYVVMYVCMYCALVCKDLRCNKTRLVMSQLNQRRGTVLTGL
jgi:hypothetical protein